MLAIMAMSMMPMASAMAFNPATVPVPNPVPAVGAMSMTAFTAPLVQYFTPGSAALTPAGEQAIAAMVAAGEASNLTHYYVNGYTDRAGPAVKNGHLSYARALAVVRVLVARGIDRGNIVIEAFGEANPAVPTRDGVSQVMNRRTESFARGEYVWR